MAENTGKEIEAKDTTSPEASPPPPPARLGTELGVDSSLPFSTPFIDPNRKTERQALQELTQGEFGEDAGPTVQQLIAMRRMDGQARALYRLLTLPIRGALSKSTFIPAEGGEEEAEFIEQVFTLPPESGGMKITFQRLMSQILMGLFDGFSAFEIVYWLPKFGPLSGKYTFEKIAYRPSNTVNFITDEQGHFEGIRQRTFYGGKTIDKYIEKDYCFYYAAQEEERKYYGVSYFQSAFYHYDKKIKMYYIAHLAGQRAAVGTRIGTHPANATTQQKAEFAQNLNNLSFAQWMMLSDDFKVESLKESGTFPFLDYINHHNSQMSKSILAAFFDKDQGAGQGDAKLVSFGQPGDKMFMLMLGTIMDEIAAQINHYLIPKLIDWNFPGQKYPKFQWGTLTDEQKQIVATTFDKLSSAGQSVTVSPEFVRELEKKMAEEMGLELDWDEIEAREEQEKAAMNAQQGLDENGMPAPLPEDQQIADFEAAATGGVPTPPLQGVTPVGPGQNPPPGAPKPKQKVALSAEQDLLQMAGDLIAAAGEHVELAGEKRVRTLEGAKKYQSPVGTLIENDQAAVKPNAPKITIERLMSLQGQLNAASATGSTEAIKEAQHALFEAVKAYSGNRGPRAVLATLRSLSMGKKVGDKKAIPEKKK